MAAGGFPPSGGKGPPGRPHRGSWAQMLESTLPSSWNKNILEVVLEKDARGAFNVSDTECSNLLTKLGIDPRPGVHIDSVQICPTGRGVILITLKQGLDINRFCRYDVLDVTRSGTRAVNVKPAGKRDVVVNIKGLHPNTRDDGVINYLGKYGKLVTNKVVYGTFGEGPLKGIKNGDRAFKIEINPGTNIGTYHAIDGQRVTIRYPGQQQTCARCHKTAVNCKGGGIAKKCEAAEGAKVEFSDYILDLWQKIGYVPGEVEMAAVYDEHGDYGDHPDRVDQQTGGLFTPTKQTSEPEKFKGVSIKQFPKDTDHGDIVEFLVTSGLPESVKDTVVIKLNGTVIIQNLENSVSLSLIDKIHQKVHFGRKLFCNGIIPLTPEKPEDIVDEGTDKSTNPIALEKPEAKVDEDNSNNPIAAPLISLSASDSSFPGTFEPGLYIPCSDNDVVRRHSLSLKSPPLDSIASQILNSRNPHETPPSYNRAKSLLGELKDLKEQISEFGSCVSEISDSSADEFEGFTVDEKRQRGFKKVDPKRKAGRTPIKDDYGKKANMDWNAEASD